MAGEIVATLLDLLYLSYHVIVCLSKHRIANHANHERHVSLEISIGSVSFPFVNLQFLSIVDRNVDCEHEKIV